MKHQGVKESRSVWVLLQSRLRNTRAAAPGNWKWVFEKRRISWDTINCVKRTTVARSMAVGVDAKYQPSPQNKRPVASFLSTPECKENTYRDFWTSLRNEGKQQPHSFQWLLATMIVITALPAARHNIPHAWHTWIKLLRPQFWAAPLRRCSTGEVGKGRFRALFNAQDFGAHGSLFDPQYKLELT